LLPFVPVACTRIPLPWRLSGAAFYYSVYCCFACGEGEPSRNGFGRTTTAVQYLCRHDTPLHTLPLPATCCYQPLLCTDLFNIFRAATGVGGGSPLAFVGLVWGPGVPPCSIAVRSVPFVRILVLRIYSPVRRALTAGRPFPMRASLLFIRLRTFSHAAARGGQPVCAVSLSGVAFCGVCHCWTLTHCSGTDGSAFVCWMAGSASRAAGGRCGLYGAARDGA
jgi:hypothetical protein